MSLAKRFNRPHLQRLWLAETIRQLERDGWLDDTSILRGLEHEQLSTVSGDDMQGLILGRADQLAESNPIVREVGHEIEAFRVAGSLLASVLAVVAVLGGAATAAAVLSGTSINIVLAWSALLGPHLVTLLAWLLGLLVPARQVGLVRGGLWPVLTQRLFGGKHRLLLVHAMTTLVARTRLLFWTYSFVSHMLWCLFYLSALATLTYLFALHEYRFKWETTILPASFFVQFVDILAWLPQQLGLRTPTPDAVMQLIDDQSTRQAWASWILSGVAAYGLLPRLALAVLSQRKRSSSGRRLALDLEQPYYVRLGQRIDAALRPGKSIIDPVPDHAVDASATSPAHSHFLHSTDDKGAGGGLIFGFELHDDVPWPPPAVPANVQAKGNLSRPGERDELLTWISHRRPHRTIVACDARTGLDRGTLHYLGDIARHSGTLGILLLKQTAARTGRAESWKEELREYGIPAALIFAESDAALNWLNNESHT